MPGSVLAWMRSWPWPESPNRRIAEALILTESRIARRCRAIRCDWTNPGPGTPVGGQRQAGQATEGAMMAEGLGMQPQSAGRRGPGSTD